MEAIKGNLLLMLDLQAVVKKTLEEEATVYMDNERENRVSKGSEG